MFLNSDTVKGIQDAEHRIQGHKQTSNHEGTEEDKSKIKAAIFYSISSTQVGLQVFCYNSLSKHCYINLICIHLINRVLNWGII